MESELSCRMWLGNIRELNDKHRRMLYAYFGTCREIYHAKHNDLAEALLGSTKNSETLAAAIRNARTKTSIEHRCSP